MPWADRGMPRKTPARAMHACRVSVVEWAWAHTKRYGRIQGCTRMHQQQQQHEPCDGARPVADLVASWAAQGCISSSSSKSPATVRVAFVTSWSSYITPGIYAPNAPPLDACRSYRMCSLTKMLIHPFLPSHACFPTVPRSFAPSRAGVPRSSLRGAAGGVKGGAEPTPCRAGGAKFWEKKKLDLESTPGKRPSSL